MRIQHAAQAAKSWPNTSAKESEAGSRLSETIERIRWRLWHGQVGRGLELIGETIMSLKGWLRQPRRRLQSHRKLPAC